MQNCTALKSLDTSTSLPKVSIIVPAYNCEEYIAQCVESLLAQTYSNIELIVIDDGSTDTTSKLLAAYEANNNKMTVLRQDNQGPSVARNHGFSHALGEWIWFIDADDYIDNGAVMLLVDDALRNSVDVVVLNLQPFDKYGYQPREAYVQKSFPQLQIGDSNALLKYMLEGRLGNYSPQFFCKRELLDDISQGASLFPPDIKMLEDVVFSTRLAAVATSVYFESSRVYYYRMRDDSLSHEISIRDAMNSINAIEFVENTEMPVNLALLRDERCCLQYMALLKVHGSNPTVRSYKKRVRKRVLFYEGIASSQFSKMTKLKIRLVQLHLYSIATYLFGRYKYLKGWKRRALYRLESN